MIIGYKTKHQGVNNFESVSKYGCEARHAQTYSNICNSWPLKVDGQAQGEVVWVNTVCEGGVLLPLKYQAPIYRVEGVHEGQIIENLTKPNETAVDSHGTFGQDPHAAPSDTSTPSPQPPSPKLPLLYN